MPRYDDRYGSTRLYVGHLSSRTRYRDLDDIFGRYGSCFKYLDMKRDYAFVEFSDPRDADDARYRMNGREIDGSRITVEFAKGPNGDYWCPLGEPGRQPHRVRPPSPPQCSRSMPTPYEHPTSATSTYQRELKIEKDKGADINENAVYFKVVGGRKRGKVYGTGVTKEYYYGSSSGSAACGGSRPGKSVCCSWQGW